MALRQREFELLDYDSRQLAQEELLNLLPKKIYKYYPISYNLKDDEVDYTLKSIINGEIYFSKPRTFNDPFDCKLNVLFGLSKEQFINNFAKFSTAKYEYLENDKELLEIFENKEQSNLFLNGILEIAINEAIGVSCFSEVITTDT